MSYPYVTPISWKGEGCACQWRVALGPDDETWIVDAATKSDALTIAQARSLLASAIKWIRRIEERRDDLPASFFDGCDPTPLRKSIKTFLDAGVPTPKTSTK